MCSLPIPPAHLTKPANVMNFYETDIFKTKFHHNLQQALFAKFLQKQMLHESMQSRIISISSNSRLINVAYSHSCSFASSHELTVWWRIDRMRKCCSILFFCDNYCFYSSFCICISVCLYLKLGGNDLHREV